MAARENIFFGILFILILISFLGAFKEEQIIYGGLFGDETGLVTFPASSTYVNVTGVNSSFLKEVEFVDDQAFLIKKTGIYKVTSQWSFSGQANTEYHLALGIDNVRNKKCHAQRKIGTGGDVGSASFTCIEKFYRGEKVTAMIENVDSTVSAFIHDIQLNIIYLSE